MIPMLIDPARTHVGLVGRGELAVRRLAWLRAVGAEPLVWSDTPSEDFAQTAGTHLVARLPEAADLDGCAALWVADLDGAALESVVAAARAARVLLNVEDVRPYCQFHTPAVVRRGQLVLAAGTGGASPAMARLVRSRLETLFPDAWRETLEAAARLRTAMKAAGASASEINAATEQMVRDAGLL